MDRCDAYRRFAADCIELTQHDEFTQDRSILLLMALVWSRLAEHGAKPVVPNRANTLGNWLDEYDVLFVKRK